MTKYDDKDDLKTNLAIEELRFKYQRQEHRDTALETKASSFLAFTAVIVTIIIFTLNSIFSSNIFDNPLINAFYSLISIIAFLIIFLGITYLLKVFRIRNYTFPFTSDPNNISKIIDLPYSDFKDYIIDDYKKTIPHLHCINEKKVRSLNRAMKLLQIGITISIILLILSIEYKLVGGL